MKLRITMALALLLGVCTAAMGVEKIILLNEGNWQADNGRVSYFEDGRVVSNQWFRERNGYKLGDTPNDIIQVNKNLIAIAVNWSNIVQFIDPTGKAVAATEDVPNNRKLASDGENYVYISSYGHECGTVNGTVTFTKGFVAKIDVRTFKVVKTVEVGYEPEGIAFYKGYLFVANTGGYAFQEDHEYETTVSMIRAEDMSLVRNIDTGTINLYGKMSQSGQYLCINSPGDYYDIPAASLVFDCEGAVAGKPDDECFVKLDYAATYNCTAMDGKFYAIGSRFSYYTGDYEFNYVVIDPARVMATNGAEGTDTPLPGTLLEDFKKIQMPYGIYVNPYTGYIYATDAGEYVAAGALLQWSPDGRFIGRYQVYINPAHFLALDPNGESGTDNILAQPASEGQLYNLQGIPVSAPRTGEIYIRDGRKFIYTE